MPDRRQFGLFDFDPESGELRREGVPVKLQAQPAQVLRLLIANAGEVVSRETLRKAVWGTETFVDFDRGLNFCIAQIRAALGDSADSPRFIRTVPKQGYQFVAPISAPAPRKLNRSVLAVAVIVSAITIWGFIVSSGNPPVRVAVTRFDNDTGSAEFDALAGGLTDSFIAELAAAGPGQFEVIGNARPLRQPKASRDLLAIGSSLKASYVILGQLQRDGNQVQAVVSLIALPEQTHVKVARVDLDTSNLFNAQIDAARRITATFLGPLAAGTRVRIPSPKPPGH